MVLQSYQYESFFQVLRDVPLTPVKISIIVALTPLLIYYVWSRPVLRQFLVGFIIIIYKMGSGIGRYFKRWELNSRAKEDYRRMTGKKMLPGQIFVYGIYIFAGVFALLILKKAFYFGVVVSQSMMPTLMVADLVLIESMTTDRVEVGDIVLITPPSYGAPVIHRVVSVKDGKIRTMGDNIGRADSWILRKVDIKGKAVMLNGKPVVVKNIGTYFMPVGKNYVKGSDPLFELIRDTAQTVHRQGPIILVVLLLLMVLCTFEGKRTYA
jgi:signal peptidase I